MHRRRLLRTLGGGALAALAGCSTVLPRTDDRDGDGTPTVGRRTPPAVGDVTLPVPESELQRGAPKDAIPAITDPAFDADWSGVAVDVVDPFTGQELTIEPRLADDDRVLGVERGGEARAYPLAILNWHEVVNDEFDGPLLATYCPLCGSGVTADRLVGGEPTVFGVSGLLWRSDLVMYDRRTGSLWSQIIATAIRGPETGNRLSLVPSSLTTWGSWRETHPDTRVLRPPPESRTVGGALVRNYAANPYRGYEDSSRVGLGGSLDDDRLHPKAVVLGVAAGDEAVAYPLSAVSSAGVVNDRVGDRPVVVAVTAGETIVAYDRRVDGRTLTFERAGDRHLRAGGSRWETATGKAVDGPFAGRRLRAATGTSSMFWFAWLKFHPDTRVYGQDG